MPAESNELSRAVIEGVERALGASFLAPEPFPHFCTSRFFDEFISDFILECLERDLCSWVVESRHFYIRHALMRGSAFTLTDIGRAISGTDVFSTMRRHLERIFCTKLSRRCDFSVNRMQPAHRVGIHNDCPLPGTESHRIVVSLNRGFTEASGGHLVLLKSAGDPAAGAITLSPTHNSAVAMAFSSDSWHRVEDVSAGTRYSLLYSFWPKSGNAAATIPDQRSPSISRTEAVKREPSEEMMTVLAELLAQHVEGDRPHRISHLTSTYALLRKWGCDTDTCNAGLFHPPLAAGNLSFNSGWEMKRGQIRQAVGDRATFLIHVMNNIDLRMFDRLINSPIVNESGAQAAMCSADVKATVAVTWATIVVSLRCCGDLVGALQFLENLFARSGELLPDEGRREVLQSMSELRKSVSRDPPDGGTH